MATSLTVSEEALKTPQIIILAINSNLLTGSEVAFLISRDWNTSGRVFTKMVRETRELTLEEKRLIQRHEKSQIEPKPELASPSFEHSSYDLESLKSFLDSQPEPVNTKKEPTIQKDAYKGYWNAIDPFESELVERAPKPRPSFMTDDYSSAREDWYSILKNTIKSTFVTITPKDAAFKDIYSSVSHKMLSSKANHLYAFRATFSEFCVYWENSEKVKFELPEEVNNIKEKYLDIDYANLETTFDIEENDYSALKEYYNNNKGNIAIEEPLKKELRNNKKVNKSVFIKLLIWLDEFVEFKNSKNG